MSERGKTFVIGWDGDGVPMRSDKPVRDVVNKLLGINIQKSDLTNWNALTEIVFRETGDQKLADELTKKWFDPNVLKLSPPNRQILEVMEKCKMLANTEQRLITTRTPACRQITLEWLQKYIGGIDWNTHLHIRQHGDIRSGDDFKVDTIRKYNVSFMSEDNATTVGRIVTEAPSCRVAYINQPWNSEDLNESRAPLRVVPTNGKELYRRIVEKREEWLSKW